VRQLVGWRVRKWSGNRVKGGPFAGMRYGEAAICSELSPKLIGCYERELTWVLQEIRLLQPEVIINAGAAEGYYAVGVIFAGIARQVIAFETLASARALISGLARMNHVSEERLVLKATCTADALESCLQTASVPVVIMDVEGHEVFLLDPARVKSLSQTYVLAEMHDCILQGMTDAITAKMAATHHITRIVSEPRSQADTACSDFLFSILPQRWRLLAVSEERPGPMTWLWMKPKIVSPPAR